MPDVTTVDDLILHNRNIQLNTTNSKFEERFFNTLCSATKVQLILTDTKRIPLQKFSAQNMKAQTLIKSTALVLLLAGCSDNSSVSDTFLSPEAMPNEPISNATEAQLVDGPVLGNNELPLGIFFDGSDFSDQGFQLLSLIKDKSNQAFSGLNRDFAEGTVPSHILECSHHSETGVISSFSCNNERDSVLLDIYGFPMFLVTTENSAVCSALPVGAFNELDCSIESFNFVSERGLYGFYRAFSEDGEISRESLTITQENIPSFIDPTTLPGSCVFELLSDGSVLLSEFGNCSTSFDELLTEFSS